MKVLADNEYTTYADGTKLGSGRGWSDYSAYYIPQETKRLAVYGHNLVCDVHLFLL